MNVPHRRDHDGEWLSAEVPLKFLSLPSFAQFNLLRVSAPSREIDSHTYQGIYSRSSGGYICTGYILMLELIMGISNMTQVEKYPREESRISANCATRERLSQCSTSSIPAISLSDLHCFISTSDFGQ